MMMMGIARLPLFRSAQKPHPLLLSNRSLTSGIGVKASRLWGVTELNSSLNLYINHYPQKEASHT